MPGKRSGKCMRMTVSSGVKTWRGVASRLGRQGTKRGSTAGTWTTANSCSSSPGRRSMTARLSDLLSRCGNGWPGSMANGVSTGKISRLEDPAQVPRVGVGQVLEAAEDDALAFQRGQHVFVQTAVDLVGHARGRSADAFELLLDRHAVGAGAVGDAGLHFLLQAADADHEEFVEVGLEDGEELQAFQQRHVWVLGLLQDAAVEFQPTQLAVEIEGRIVQARHGRLGRRMTEPPPERKMSL